MKNQVKLLFLLILILNMFDTITHALLFLVVVQEAEIIVVSSAWKEIKP
jgi:hypothetical protein